MVLEDWSPRPLPGSLELSGRRVVLEPLDWAVHRDGLYAAVAAPDRADIWTHIPFGPFRDIAQFEHIFETVRAGLGWRTMVIRRVGEGRILGTASYMRQRPEHGSAEIGCVAFGPELQRTIEATEAMYLMAHHLFEDLGYRRCEWKCDNENTASKAAAERLGFVFEGVFRQDQVVKGRNRDTAWFAMLDCEWPALKAAFEAWLSDDNFDEAGRQRRSLASLRSPVS